MSESLWAYPLSHNSSSVGGWAWPWHCQKGSMIQTVKFGRGLSGMVRIHRGTTWVHTSWPHISLILTLKGHGGGLMSYPPLDIFRETILAARSCFLRNSRCYRWLFYFQVSVTASYDTIFRENRGIPVTNLAMHDLSIERIVRPKMAHKTWVLCTNGQCKLNEFCSELFIKIWLALFIFHWLKSSFILSILHATKKVLW